MATNEIDNIFAFMSACTGHKNTFGHEPFTGRRTVVSDVGLTDGVSHGSCIEKGGNARDPSDPSTTTTSITASTTNTRQVCDATLPLLRKTGPNLPRTGIFLDEDDMEMFELNADGTPAKGDTTGSNVMRALSLGTLFYGMLSLSDAEILFQLHPNKSAWHLKGREMYGFGCAQVFTDAFSLRCAMPTCMYRSYFPHVALATSGGGPAVLPMFVRRGLVNEVPQYMRQLSAFLSVQQTTKCAYPLMCLPCLLVRQIHNRFTERLSFDADRPQLSPFTVVDLERENGLEEGDSKPTTTTAGAPASVGITSRPSFADKYIERCKKGQADGWQGDLYELNERSYYLTRLPFHEIEIINDNRATHSGGYVVRWRDGRCSRDQQ